MNMKSQFSSATVALLLLLPFTITIHGEDEDCSLREFETAICLNNENAKFCIDMDMTRVPDWFGVCDIEVSCPSF
jgi:hypothetical protein